MSQELNGTLTNSAKLVGTFGTSGGGGTNNYNDLTNKPQINGVELQGNKTTSNLNISYNDIGNKPTINGVMLQGNKTTSNLNISYNDLKNKPTLAAVATSGSYDDLTNKPTIPAAQVNSDWNSTSGVSEILNKPTLAAVATSGDYDDLTNKPTIPAAQVNSDWNSTSGVSEILNKPTLAAVATSGSYSDLSGTPTIPVNSDFALSGLSDTDITTPTANQVLAYDGDNWVNSSALDDKQDKAILSIKKTFANTYTLQTCIGALITEYGSNTMAFGFVLTGSGWYEGMMSFYDTNQGGGFVVMNGGTPRLWAISYQNGTVSVSEK